MKKLTFAVCQFKCRGLPAHLGFCVFRLTGQRTVQKKHYTIANLIRLADNLEQINQRSEYPWSEILNDKHRRVNGVRIIGAPASTQPLPGRGKKRVRFYRYTIRADGGRLEPRLVTVEV